MVIENFTAREKAFKAMESIKNFDFFDMYLSGHITEEEKEIISDLLDTIHHRVELSVREFENSLK